MPTLPSRPFLVFETDRRDFLGSVKTRKLDGLFLLKLSGFLVCGKVSKNNNLGACNMQKYATIKAQASYG